MSLEPIYEYGTCWYYRAKQVRQRLLVPFLVYREDDHWYLQLILVQAQETRLCKEHRDRPQ